MNDILAAITSRRSVRAFLNKSVDPQILTSILETARYAPSGVNTQPWQVCVLGAATLKALGDELIQARAQNVPEHPDYQYYPKEWPPIYKERRVACGQALYGALKINKNDMEARLEQWNKNYRFFGAPIGLIITIDKRLEQGSWMDLGMFIQNIMIAARAFELGTCPEASLAEHPDIVRRVLSLSDNDAIACGIALGYPDEQDPVNQYRTTREPVDKFTRWYD